MKRVDIVAVNPELINAARFFRADNKGALEDKRVIIHFSDLSEWVIGAGGNYDVIFQGAATQRISGQGLEFTKEHYD